MAVVDFRDEGFLQEANRLFFHPRGLALSVVIESGGSARLSGIWDCREDPDGIVFAKGLLSTDKALAMCLRARSFLEIVFKFFPKLVP